MAPEDAPTPEQVADAFLHLARLAAAHANYGVDLIEVEGEKWIEHKIDGESLEVLAEVAAVLRRDRERVSKKLSALLVSRAHAIMEQELAGVRRESFDPDAERLVEDRIEDRLRDELGLSLTAEEKKSLAVDAEEIVRKKGPSNTAAELMGRILGRRSGRTVYTSIETSDDAPPVPAPANRWVSLREVDKYVRRVFARAVAARKKNIVFPLNAVREVQYFETVMGRVETMFKQRAIRGFNRVEARALSALFCLSLLRGDEPPVGLALDDQRAEQLVTLQSAAAGLGEQIQRLAEESRLPADALLRASAEAMAENVVEWIWKTLEL